MEQPNRTDTYLVMDFFSGGGEMGGRIRNFNWSQTPLGHPASWQQSLKTTLSICLNSNFPIALYWGKDLILVYNDAWSPILGEKHPAALGKPANAVWPEIWTDIEPQFNKAFQGEPGGSRDALLPMHRHGYTEECYFDFTFTPVFGESGKVEGVFNAVIETTYRILNEHRSRFLNELTQLVAAVSSAKQVFSSVIRYIQSHDQTISFASLYSGQQEPAELVDSTLAKSALKQPWPFEKVKEIFFINDVNDYLIEVPQGRWPEKPKEAVIIPLPAGEGNVVNYLVCGLHAGRRYDAEYQSFFESLANIIINILNTIVSFTAERTRAHKLEELDKAKTIFFSNISHEFRTPLTLMLGTLEESLSDPEIVRSKKERLLVTHRNAMRLLKLVNTLLDFSRIESGRQKANYALTDIEKLTTDLASNFRSLMENAGLRYIVKTDTIIQPVYVDRSMWEKIVFNLLSNALKYTLKGSVTLHLFSREEGLVMKVTDTGIGIPENDLPRMFERFHRVENAVGRTFEGTGIGLSLIKELVLLHGGRIDVESKINKGSTFTVTLPFGKAHLPAGQTAELPLEWEHIVAETFIEEATALFLPKESMADMAPSPALETVLVVDDNADMRLHIQSLLQTKFHVITAANGREALDKINDKPPALVLSDIMMPVMDGIQLVKEMKASPSLSRIPVVLLTARAGEESRIEGFATGADDYLVKPFASSELLARIKAQIDISKKRREVEYKLTSFLKQAPAAVAVFEGQEHLITLANAQYQQMIGRPENALVGKPLREAFPELEGQAVYELYDKVYDSGTPFFSSEFPVMINVEGQAPAQFYFDFALQPIKDAEGNSEAIILHAVDVTEKVKARNDRIKALAELEQRVEERTAELNEQNAVLQQQNYLIRKIFDSSVDLMAVYDLDTRLVSVNQASLTLMKRKEEEVLGKKLLEFLPEIKGTKNHLDLLRAISGETIFNEIYRSPVFGRYYQNFIIPLKNEEGKIYGVLTVAHDNTELIATTEGLKTKNEELEAARSFLEQLIDSSVEFILVLDKNLRVITCNNKYEEVMGIGRHAIVGQHILSITPGAEGSEQHESILKALKGETVYLDKRPAVARPDYYVDTYFIPLRLQDKVNGVIIMSRDVSELVRSEQLLQQKNNELQQSLDMLRSRELKDVQKTNFISMASHELKTPITTIKGYVQLALNMFDNEKEGKQISFQLLRTSLVNVDKQVRRLTRLVSELLDLTKIETGSLQLIKERFSLNELVAETVEDMLYTGTSHKFTISHNFQGDVYADRDRIEQVLINLIANAIKYSPGSDKIEVTVFEAPGDLIGCSIKDYGIGIDSREHLKIFERFYRAIGKEELTYPGFGIGLFIANEFIEKHGGQMKVVSERGMGSTFTFLLSISRW